MPTDASELIATDRSEPLDRFSVVALAVVGLLLLCKAWMAVDAAFEVDEFSSFNLGAGLLADPIARLAQPHRLGASVVFAAGVVLGQQDPVVGMVVNRVIAVGTCVVIYLGVLRIAGRAFGTLAGIHALVGLGMVHVFIDHSFTARTDMIWLALCTSALALLLDRRAGAVAGAGVLLGLAYFVSLKSILMQGAVGAGLLAAVLVDRRRGLRDLAILAAGYFGVHLAYVALRMAVRSPSALQDAELRVLQVQSYIADSGVRFGQFGLSALRHNPVFAALAVTALVLVWIALVRRRMDPDRRRDVVLVATIVPVYLLAMQTYPHRWPYFLATAVPGLALFWGALCGAAHRRLREQTGSPLWIAAVVALAVLGGVRPLDRVARNLELDNAYQVAMMDRVQQILGPDDTYFDGVGMVPTRTCAAPQWLDVVLLQALREDPDQLEALIDLIVANDVGALVVNWRIDQLPEAFQEFRETYFVQDWGNVFVPGRAFDTGALVGGSAALPALTAGTYHVRGPELAWRGLRIDGQPLTGPAVRLEAGLHAVGADRDVGEVRILRLDEGFVETREPLNAYKELFPRERFLLAN